ncbi:flagellar export chaperone FliS [Pantoea sp. A4]|uniref:flagellar export chaperone FliS n=1 Tax=Pantoea sp. A4 TaxID=1225184 RepID=UPI000379B995|nr:flagellar export chaperone FliS [Pantoea sp. A4]
MTLPDYSTSTHGWQETDLEIQTAAATPQQLVLILFNGFDDELQRLKGHISQRRIEHKTLSVEKCVNILQALTSALDFERGGELARSLASLYDYCIFRLYAASLELSVAAIDEVEKMMRTLRAGWEEMKP